VLRRGRRRRLTTPKARGPLHRRSRRPPAWGVHQSLHRL